MTNFYMWYLEWIFSSSFSDVRYINGGIIPSSAIQVQILKDKKKRHLKITGIVPEL